MGGAEGRAEGEAEGSRQASLWDRALVEVGARGVGRPLPPPPKEASLAVAVGTQQDPTGHNFVFPEW